EQVNDGGRGPDRGENRQRNRGRAPQDGITPSNRANHHGIDRRMPKNITDAHSTAKKVIGGVVLLSISYERARNVKTDRITQGASDVQRELCPEVVVLRCIHDARECSRVSSLDTCYKHPVPQWLGFAFAD